MADREAAMTKPNAPASAALQARCWAVVGVAVLAGWACAVDPADPPVALPPLRALPASDPTGCNWQIPAAQGFVKSAGLKEISGVAASRRHPGHLWVHNDSGAKPEVHLLAADGQLRLALHLDGAPHTDWEDMALAQCPAKVEAAAGAPPASRMEPRREAGWRRR